MPWTPRQNKMWHARAERGDPTAKKVVGEPGYKVKKNTPKPKGASRRRKKGK